MCVIVGLTAIASCSRQGTGPCEPEARYSTASSAQPVQIPDDLSPPDESDAIRLPTDVAAVGSITAGVCLEKSPPFFGDSRPFLTNAEAEESRKSRREARREAKRAERGETSAAPSAAAPASQPEASPPPQANPPPAGDDRVIDN